VVELDRDLAFFGAPAGDRDGVGLVASAAGHFDGIGDAG
jgi:hypothetical protein